MRLAGLGAILGYLAGMYLSLFDAGSELGQFPVLLSVAAIALASWLMAAAPRRPADGREQALSARVAEVSHELRTPLTHILGFSEMIERKIFGEVMRVTSKAGLIRRAARISWD